MAIIVGICPNCNEAVSTNKKAVFFTCKHCGENVPLRQAVSYITEMCEDPTLVNNVVNMCLHLEETDDIEIPLTIMQVLRDKNPYNEMVAYTHLRMSGYEQNYMRHYLDTFAAVKGEKPFAEDFLEHALQPQNAIMCSLIETYITNKLPAKKQKEYLQKLVGMKEQYVGRVGDGDGLFSMYALYLVGAAINVGLVFLFIFVDLHQFVFYILAGMAIFGAEMLALYVHNRIYGNRLGMKQTEVTLLICFLCSVPIAIAGMIIGGLL